MELGELIKLLQNAQKILGDDCPVTFTFGRNAELCCEIEGVYHNGIDKQREGKQFDPFLCLSGNRTKKEDNPLHKYSFTMVICSDGEFEDCDTFDDPMELIYKLALYIQSNYINKHEVSLIKEHSTLALIIT